MVILFVAQHGLAQDSTYVKKYGNLLCLKSFLYNDSFSFNNKSTGLSYIPGLHSGVGLGLWCKYFPFDICYRQELSQKGSRHNYKYVRSIDMQLRGYNRFFAGDIYIQKYSGFYESIKNRYRVKGN